MTSHSQTERFDTVVIGGGQAGLAVGYYLGRQGRQFVILEAADRIGDSWRNRWDGLRLFTSAHYDSLPGIPFPARPHDFPTKDEVADYLESYATRLDLPVRTGMAVDRLVRTDTNDGYMILVAGDRRLRAFQVVIATGAYHKPRVPAFAVDLDPTIRQLHSSQYRNASQLRDGPVLVVGASNSGAEVAMSAAVDHRTVLSGRDTGKMPARLESRLAHLIDLPFWYFINHIARTDNPIGRKARPFLLNHGGPLERIWPSDLAAAGVERIYARAVGAQGGLPVLDDGQIVDVSNVIWCTGFRPDFDWIQPPIAGADGWPVHERGVVANAPGLYVVGLPFLYSAASALLGGVGRDAAYIADRIAERVTGPASKPARAAVATS